MERYAQVLERLKGPVVPINICFTADDDVDYPAMRKYVSYLCEEGVPVLLLTGGSSEYAALSDEEIWRLTAELAEEIGGRSVFVASTGSWHPRLCREFLQHADRSGVDAVKVQMCHGAIMSADQISSKREVIFNYFDAIQDAAPIPLLFLIGGGMTVPVDVIAELGRRPQVIGTKNDGDAFYLYYDLIRATRDQDFAVISGGQMRNFAFGYQLGSAGYLCTIAPFLPRIAMQFYNLLVAGKLDEAWEIVTRYEEPWMKVALKLGWLHSIKSAENIYGLVPTNYVRRPGASHTAEQREQVRQGLEDVFGPIEVQHL